MQQAATFPAGSPAGARPTSARRSSSLGDTIFSGACHAAGAFVLLLLGAIIIELFLGGLPAFRAFGLPFIWSTEWDPVTEVFGAGVSIYGTIVTSVLAIILAVPVRIRRRLLPDRAGAALAAPPGWHRG